MIPFYGSRHPELFAIERAAMDRPGHVTDALRRVFAGTDRLLDIGAGDGFTARALSTDARRVVALEPDGGMIDAAAALPWARGVAESLPFATSSFGGAYATWACFFPSFHAIDGAVAEVERVVRPGGPIALVNNLGDDEFTALAPRDISEPVQPFLDLGFSLDVIKTRFEFESLHQAQELLGFYFGDAGREGARLSLGYRVGLFHKRSPGAGAEVP